MNRHDPQNARDPGGAEGERPILFLDVDGVISPFGFAQGAQPHGELHTIDGVAHCIGRRCGELVRRLAERYELVWATGWEQKANRYLLSLLGLPPRELPCLTFDGSATFGPAHWKLEAIDRYAGDRPAAWIDDNLRDERCRAWAAERRAPTLLIPTESAVGLSEDQVERLLEWADEVEGRPQPKPPTRKER